MAEQDRFVSFPDYVGGLPQGAPTQPEVKVMGACRTCGAPIYGPTSVPPGKLAFCQKTCECHFDMLQSDARQKDIRDTWHTK